MAKKREFSIAVISALRQETTSTPVSHIMYSVCGVGIYNAIVHTAALCEAHCVDAIYFIGSAGALNSSLSVQTLVVPRYVMCSHTVDNIQAEGVTGGVIANTSAYTSISTGSYREKLFLKYMSPHKESTAAYRALEISDGYFAEHIAMIMDCLSDISREPLLTSNVPITKDGDRKHMHDLYKADAVDMESYGVACVASYYHIPLLIIKYITDQTHADMHTFNNHLPHCAITLERALMIGM